MKYDFDIDKYDFDRWIIIYKELYDNHHLSRYGLRWYNKILKIKKQNDKYKKL